MNVESEDFRLLDSGAAGAFIHGLEDERSEVRTAAVGKCVCLVTRRLLEECAC